MSTPREGLLGRFRATLQQRAKNVRAMFEVLEFMPGEPEALRQVLGELHTLKGEARMLGLLELGELAHELEEVVETGASLDFPTLNRVAESLNEALSESSAEVAEGRLSKARRVLAGSDTATSKAPEATATAAPGGSQSVPAIKQPDGRDGQRWVSVQATTIDRLCDRMSELSAAFGLLQGQLRADRSEENGRGTRVALVNSLLHYRELLDSCVDATWDLRLITLEPMLRELQQHARLLLRREGKSADVVVECGGVQLERDVVDLVWDSLLHLVRNAIAHGLEEEGHRGGKPARGTLLLRAESVGPNVVISVQDDGQGIDPARLRAAALERGTMTAAQVEALSDTEAVELIYRHGFSTESTADDLSGRGVGLDVVKARIESVGGAVRVSTRIGEGTQFELTVPFAITKEQVLVIELGQAKYGIPARVVRSVVGKETLQSVNGSNVLRYASSPIPLRSLAQALGMGDVGEEAAALVLELGGKLFAAKVPGVLGEHELVRRPAEELLASTGVGASALLDDGQLALLLDLGFLERRLSRVRSDVAPVAKVEVGVAKQNHVLVVDDSPVVTEMISELLTTSGISVEVASDGIAALAAMERQAPDLVLSDVDMPRMDGISLLKEIRQKTQTLPVVMLTTRGSVEDRQRASSLGANAYVLKSGFQSDVLLDVVSRFLSVKQ